MSRGVLRNAYHALRRRDPVTKVVPEQLVVALREPEN